MAEQHWEGVDCHKTQAFPSKGQKLWETLEVILETLEGLWLRSR